MLKKYFLISGSRGAAADANVSQRSRPSAPFIFLNINLFAKK